LTKYRKQNCSWIGCKRIVEIDANFDIPALGALAGKFCDFHDQVYAKMINQIENEILNSKEIKN